MSMHGRGITSSSMIWTVFSSMKRPPQSHAEMMFWLSCVCGPADGPMGVRQAACAEEVRQGIGRCRCAACSNSDSWMPKIERLCSYSIKHPPQKQIEGLHS